MKKFLAVLLIVALGGALYLINQDEYLAFVDMNVTRMRKHEGDEFVRVYATKENSRIYIIDAQGYNPGLMLKVEIDDEDIKALEIISHNETDKYGGYAEQEWFRNRFLGEYPDKFELVKIRKEAPGEIVALTGATITTRAIIDAVNLCIENYGG